MDQVTPVPQSSTMPIVLAYPRVYENLLSNAWNHEFANVIAKCCELTTNRPLPKDRHGGFFGLGSQANKRRLYLLTIWANMPDERDIFIIGGWGDGFGPGHTCPTEAELQAGIFGNLLLVDFL